MGAAPRMASSSRKEDLLGFLLQGGIAERPNCIPAYSPHANIPASSAHYSIATLAGCSILIVSDHGGQFQNALPPIPRFH